MASASSTPPSGIPSWYSPLKSVLGLTDKSTLKEIFEKADETANELAPDTRRLWKWVLTLEGMAVLMPLLWLTVLRLRWPAGWPAFFVLACTLAVVGVCWWLRWRGSQRAWTTARVLAEIARAMRATAWIPGQAVPQALSGAPSLQAVAAALPDEEPDAAHASLGLEDVRTRYLNDRIVHQLNFYSTKRNEAWQQRKRLSRWVTWSLDGALILAFAGLMLAISGSAPYLMEISGTDYLLCLTGTALPLIAILMQTCSSYLELNRRMGRYTQQIDFLEAARVRMEMAGTMDEALAIVDDVEQALLGEVVEWFYLMQSAEIFYRPRLEDQIPDMQRALSSKSQPWMKRLRSGLSTAGSFLVSVILLRVIICVVTIVVTTAWIAYRDGDSERTKSRLNRMDGRLASHAKAEAWVPNPANAQRGFVLIAHGLNDGIDLPVDKYRWMGTLQSRIQHRMRGHLPEICLVDWHDAAGAPTIGDTLVSKVGAIKPRGEEIGRLVGCKLVLAIKDGKIHPDQPMHFIGHSAGGFVILGTARTMMDLGVTPKNLHLTLLDTPIPDTDMESDLRRVLEVAKVDYYRSSECAQAVPTGGMGENYKFFDISPDPKAGIWTKLQRALDAHSHAHQWYIKSVDDFSLQGFTRSPFATLATLEKGGE